MILKLFTLTSVYITVAITSPVLIEKHAKEYPDFRLNGHTRPTEYELWIETLFHTGDDHFTGEVNIKIIANEVTNWITLNAKDLKIDALTVKLNGVDDIDIDDYSIVARDEILLIVTAEPLVIGVEYVIHVEYSATLRDGVKGFYKGSYFNGEGDTVLFASTQFQATEARTAFPCYDEPGYKAQFTIHIKHSNTLKAISNMPGIEVLQGDMMATSFEKTPIISTYILAFVISDLDVIETLRQGELPHRIYVQENKKHLAQMALDMSVKTFDAYEEYFKADYPLSKVEIVVVPQFQTGAMENWGLVASNPNAILTEEEPTLTDDEYILRTIAHEYAHNYFGNLVTPEWWSELWLSEAFASFYEFYVDGKIYSELRLEEMFVVKNLMTVFWRDSFESTFAMEREALLPSEINSLFNNIVYVKGSCVVRMMHYAFGEETFVKGLQSFLTSESYKAVTANDLYRELQKAVSEAVTVNPPNIADIFESWVQQSGYPVLHVNFDKVNRKIEVSQKRFFMEEPELEDNKLWHVPFSFTTSISPNFKPSANVYWLSEESTIIDLPENADPYNWVIFNLQSSGYYRVNYDTSNWNELIKHLNSDDFENIPPVDRAVLIDNSLLLARAGELDYEIPLDLLQYLARETDYIPWFVAFDNLKALMVIFSGSEVEELLNTEIQKMVEPIFNKLGVDEIQGESRFDKLLRPIIIDLACSVELPQCIGNTTALVESVIKIKLAVDRESRRAIYCGGLKSADLETFQEIYRMINDTSLPITHHNDVLHAFTCVKDEMLIISIIQTIFYDRSQQNIYRDGEPLLVARSLLKRGHMHVNLLLEYIQGNYDELLSLNSARLIQIILDFDEFITTVEHLEIYKGLIEKIKFEEPVNSQLSLKNAERKIEWKLAAEKQVLNKYSDEDDGAATQTLNNMILISLVALVLSKYFE